MNYRYPDLPPEPYCSMVRSECFNLLDKLGVQYDGSQSLNDLRRRCANEALTAST
jgi:hypothetical protein